MNWVNLLSHKQAVREREGELFHERMKHIAPESFLAVW